MKIEVVPHQLQWRDEFNEEARLVAAALGDNVAAVHHIGSTAIPYIYSKPIIDLLVEVHEIREVDRLSSAMESLGYEIKGEFGIPGRRYFRKDNPRGIRTHQIHIFESGSSQIERHLAFRDYLIAHPDEARKYGDLKRKLADEHPEDPERYMDGKDGFIKEIDRSAAQWRGRSDERGSG
ncbi:MAG TPA: GrpB family protein [Pyrinomonadaceae bacterium]